MTEQERMERSLSQVDPEIYDAIQKETERQNSHLELIASENFTSEAILEEGGILGGAGLAMLIVWLGLRAWRNTDLRWRAMFVACLGINVGECVFLSPGGIGMFDWLLLGPSQAERRKAR